MPSGRSCASRILSAGKLRIDDSSVMVPLSEITARAASASGRSRKSTAA